jgi:DNA polymerase-3 subunit chi
VTEIHFYHLQRQELEEVLPTLLARSRERGWRALVKLASPERLAALDDRLWSHPEDSFLPHGAEGAGDEADQPVLLTVSDGNPNGAAILFLLEGAAWPADVAGFERVALLLDGRDEEAVAAARADWRRCKAAGHPVTYWAQDDGGRWRNRA